MSGKKDSQNRYKYFYNFFINKIAFLLIKTIFLPAVISSTPVAIELSISLDLYPQQPVSILYADERKVPESLMVPDFDYSLRREVAVISPRQPVDTISTTTGY